MVKGLLTYLFDSSHGCTHDMIQCLNYLQNYNQEFYYNARTSRWQIHNIGVGILAFDFLDGPIGHCPAPGAILTNSKTGKTTKVVDCEPLCKKLLF